MDPSKPAARPARRRRWAYSPRHAVGRLLIATVLGVVAFAGFTPVALPWWMRAVVGWDVAAFALVVLAWTVILRADNVETKRRAGSDDPGRHIVFAVALVSSMFSFFAAAFVLRRVKSLPEHLQFTWMLVTLAAIVLAWMLAHTMYTLRYAHLYYRSKGKHGLQFPGDEPPSDIDFAYFSFTIGMCFQVSDVVITSTTCRRAALLHAMLSFVYNTAILALALNLVFGSMS